LAKLGKKISWQEGKIADTHTYSPDALEVSNYLADFCAKSALKTKLFQACKVFEDQKRRFKKEHAKFIENISGELFVASFLIWIKEVGALRNDTFEAAKTLLENELIGITDSKGKPWTLEKAKSFDHSIILDTIRCHREWPLQLRETIVRTYTTFLAWLWTETQGYINRFEDPDLLKIQNRALSYPFFITFLEALTNDKARIVAKLLYFGGSRTLEEILQLKIEDVIFEKQFIQFKTHLIAYPTHVFDDIKFLTKPSTKGKVFRGRQNAPLNPATIFRNFKEAALKTNLGSNFTPANLTTNS
jgi:hypothetical protein